MTKQIISQAEINRMRELSGMGNDKKFIPRIKMSYADETKGSFVYEEGEEWKEIGKEMTGTILLITRQLRNFDETMEKTTIRSNEFTGYEFPLCLYVDESGETKTKNFQNYQEAKAYDERLKLEINL